MTLMQPAFAAWLLKATALLMLALAVTAVLRRAAAGTRHLVWLGTLAGILLLPAVSAWAPLRIAIVPAELMPSFAQPVMEQNVSRTIQEGARTPGAVPTTVLTSAPTKSSAPTAANHFAVTPNERTFAFWPTMLTVYGAIALGLLGWLGFGALSVRRIVKSGRELDERAWTGPLCEIADRLDLDAVPRLLSSPLIEMPFACGVVQPTIVLPASAEAWSDSRRRAVLFHELAHVKRRDLVGHTLGRLACVFYWFHPLVWTAARRLRAESERACDDLVLSCGARASDYADHLLDIVISVRHHGAPATAMPMARRRELEGRVLAILDPAVARIGPGRIQSAMLVVGLGALALSVAAIAPARAKAALAATAQRSEVKLDTTAHSRPNVVLLNAGNRVTLIAAPKSANPTPAPSPEPVARLNPTPAPTPAVSTDAPTFAGALNALTRVAVQSAASTIANVVEGHSKNGRQNRQGVDTAKVALLLKVLRTDPDADVRKMAAWGLSEAGDVLGSIDALAEAVRHDEDDGVREMAAWALADSRREAAHRALSSAAQRDPSEHVRETAVWGLGNAGLRDEDREVLENVLASDESAEVRESAAWGLGNTPRRPAAKALITALRDKSPEVRESAAWALAEIEDEDAAPAVEAAFSRETSSEVRMAELRALTFMHVESKTILDAALASKDAELRARAVRMLAGSSGSWPEPRPRPRPRPMP
jgi:beta-lactamase regulating signal transducer with metallopeptidase domain/HEAT repeat protein